MKALILHCAHDLSLTGAEGPIAELGRWPILWSCDECGATVLDPADSGTTTRPTLEGEKPPQM